MRNIFSRRGRKANIRFSLLLPVLTFLPVFMIFVYGIGSVSNANTSREKESLEDTLDRDIMHCYAVDGVYPPSLEFIEKNYGLHYDTERLYIDYQPVASNIYPDVTVIEIGGNNKGGSR